MLLSKKNIIIIFISEENMLLIGQPHSCPYRYTFISRYYQISVREHLCLPCLEFNNYIWAQMDNENHVSYFIGNASAYDQHGWSWSRASRRTLIGEICDYVVDFHRKYTHYQQNRKYSCHYPSQLIYTNSIPDKREAKDLAHISSSHAQINILYIFYSLCRLMCSASYLRLSV